MNADPKSAKKTDSLTVSLLLLGSAKVKAAHEMLVKLTPVVNFINILPAAFAPILFHQKVTKPNCNKRKAAQFAFIRKTL